MGMDFDQVDDRRGAARLESHLRAYFSDYNYEWEGICTSISVSGCFLESDERFPTGKEIEVRIVHPDGDEIKVDGMVRWARPAGRGLEAGMGIAFDLRARAIVEQITDFVERFALEDVQLATRYRDASQPMSIMTVLHPARGAPADPVLNDAERTFLAWVDGGRTLRDIREVVGEESWEKICYAPFSLLGKGVLTSQKALAAPPKAQTARSPTRPPPSVGQVESRNAQAHAHYEKAMAALEANDKRRALVELRLAIMLAPGDAEISRMIAELEE
jgi:hypothetical protein